MENMKKKKQDYQSKINERKGDSLKIFGNSPINGDDGVSSLVGSIVEKGDFPTDNNISKPIKPPQPQVLPFPVARHRSDGPHWGQRSNRTIDEEDEEVDEDDKGFANIDPLSVFAKPVQRKEKKSLDLGLRKELMKGDDSSVNKGKEEQKSLSGKTERKRIDGERMRDNGKKSMLSDAFGVHSDVVAPMDVDVESNLNAKRSLTITEEAVRSESGVSSISEMDLYNSHQLDDIDAESNKFSGELGSMLIDNQVMAKGKVHDDSAKVQIGVKEKIDPTRTMVTKQFHNVANECGSMSLESEIDAENRARLDKMSSEEIAQAQAELMGKMDPALLNLLKKRGLEKLKKRKTSNSTLTANSELGIRHENLSNSAINSPNTESSISKMMANSSNSTKSGSEQNVNPINGSLWNSWSQRVEAVRDLRFSLEGTVVENDFVQMPDASGNNVAERDFLRTEGDPGAAGYTIKEAVMLTRSMVPGQRSLALHLLASVLDKALCNIYRNPVGCTLTNNSKGDNSVDWEAIWAYAFGPEPELVLSLRMCLDDNHNSVVLASAKVIQCLFSCDLNESFFDLLEKTAIDVKDTYTAPIFRSKPDIDVGFHHGGFWKYSAKPSNILLYGDDNIDDQAEEDGTIQDDIIVAGQDFAAALVRMGILLRIRYLLELEPTAALEECMISILLAIARHSPTCADAIMKCERLVQTIVHRFTASDNMDVYMSKIKSVRLLKVLAQSDPKICGHFIENGSFQAMTWHLYKNALSLEQWLSLGREDCKLSSVLMVEQLRFWKVCIQNGYCVSYFSNIFPALCLWLNPPTIEKLVEKEVLSEYASISEEAYLVLESLARTLPKFYSQNFQIGRGDDNVETWSWSHVGPMVDLAVKWISFKSTFLGSQDGMKENSVFHYKYFSALLWVYSAVMHMLERVLERVIPEDTIGLQEEGGHMPWLPDFVPKVGLEIIRNGFLNFTHIKTAEYGASLTRGSSFIEQLCSLRQQGEFETSLASTCCLHGFFQVFKSINNLIDLAKAGISNPSPACSFSQEENILSRGILIESLSELRVLFNNFSKLVASEWHFVQSVEIFGRGGPAPGVGIGWGASGGGFWSKTVLLAQIDARFLCQLLEFFQTMSMEVVPADEERDFTKQMIHSALEICLIAGPRDEVIVEKALDVMVQVPVLKYLDRLIHHFTQGNGRLKLYNWECKEDDYLLYSKILGSHYRDRWLSRKKKSKALSSGGISKGRVSLETIPEDLDTSNMMNLVVEWAHQRLPLPVYWFLSPISTLCVAKNAGLGSVSDIQKIMQDPGDILEVAKAGMFFLLGLEAMSAFMPADVASPVKTVPLIWKLHSLSIILLIGMAVLEDEKSRDTFESLQEAYGQLLDETREKRGPEAISNMAINLPLQTTEQNDLEYLRFRSEIHETYSTFVDNLVEQYAAISFGDLIFGRQVAVYLHRCVESPVRLAAWNALSNSRVLELLPPLQKCFGEAEGYLEPVEENEGILEAYMNSWVSGALDRAATRDSIAFTLGLHHLSSFVFLSHNSYKLLLRNKLVKSLLRDYSRKKQQHEGMILEFIQYAKPTNFAMAKEKEGLPPQRSNVEERLDILKEACEGNSSLLKQVEELKVLLSERMVVT